MANIKISALPAATAAAAADVVPIVQGGVTKRLSFGSLMTSPALFGPGVSTFLAAPTSANLRAILSDETGTGSAVFANTPTVQSPTISSGNLAFSGTAQRITGDMSNATLANRLMFQTSTTNGQTAISLLPNGTSTQSQFVAYGGTDPANASFGHLLTISTEVSVRSSVSGTGTFLPMTFYTGGSERVRVDTSGNVGIGTASPGALLHASAANAVIRIGLSASNQYTDIYRDNVTGYTIYNAAQAATFRGHIWQLGGSEAMRIDSSGNIVAGASAALATTATDGFLYVPTCAGTPTGVPTAITGMAPIVVNTTNNKLYFYSGGVWRDAGP